MGKVVPARVGHLQDRFAACVGKARYPNGTLAARTARKSKYPGNQPYRCPFCGQFHIGRPPTSARPEED